MAVGGVFFGMGNLDDGGAGFVEPFEELHDLVALCGVEITGGFIGENEFGILNDGTGDADKLLLTAGELVGEEILFGDDVEAVESVANKAGAFFLRNVFVGERNFKIFVDSEVVDQVIRLEDETDVVFVEFVALFGVHFVYGLIKEVVFAAPGGIEHADDAEERGLPRPGGTHEGDEFAGLDFERDAAENVKLIDAGVEGFFDVVELDE